MGYGQIVDKIFTKCKYEYPHVDFKRKYTLVTEEAKAEFLRDCLCLLNVIPDELFGSNSYLYFGFGEINGMWDQSCNAIENFSHIELDLVNLITNYITPTPIFRFLRILLPEYELFRNSIEAGKESWNPTDEVVILELRRHSKTVYELGKPIGKNQKYVSWYRRASHKDLLPHAIRTELMQI